MTEQREMWSCPNCGNTEPLDDVDGYCSACGEFDANGPFDLPEAGDELADRTSLRLSLMSFAIEATGTKRVRPKAVNWRVLPKRSDGAYVVEFRTPELMVWNYGPFGSRLQASVAAWWHLIWKPKDSAIFFMEPELRRPSWSRKEVSS